MRQRTPVDVLQLATQRHTVCEPGGLNLMPTRQLGEVMRSRLTFDRGAGRDNEFFDLPFAQPGVQHVQTKFARPTPIQRDNRPISTK
jgi:trehalose utilization protein